jgi:outer membrane protein assembly factor BamD (BamD/ComL family)
MPEVPPLPDASVQVEIAAEPPVSAPAASPKIRRASFEEETAILGKVMASLKQNDFAAARKYLRRHELNFPEGVLVQERELMAVQLLLSTQEREKARVRVDKFREKWPTSPHLRRLESMLSDR